MILGCRDWLEEAMFRRLESQYLNEPDLNDRYGVRRVNRVEEARREAERENRL